MRGNFWPCTGARAPAITSAPGRLRAAIGGGNQCARRARILGDARQRRDHRRHRCRHDARHRQVCHGQSGGPAVISHHACHRTARDHRVGVVLGHSRVGRPERVHRRCTRAREHLHDGVVVLERILGVQRNGARARTRRVADGSHRQQRRSDLERSGHAESLRKSIAGGRRPARAPAPAAGGPQRQQLFASRRGISSVVHAHHAAGHGERLVQPAQHAHHVYPEVPLLPVSADVLFPERRRHDGSASHQLQRPQAGDRLFRPVRAAREFCAREPGSLRYPVRSRWT